MSPQRFSARKTASLVFVFLILLYVWNTTKERLHSVVHSFYQTRVVEDTEKSNDDLDDFKNEDNNEFNKFGTDSNTSIFLLDALSWEGGFIIYRVATMALLFMAGLALFHIAIKLLKKDDNEPGVYENVEQQTLQTFQTTDVYYIIQMFALDWVVGILWLVLSSVFITLYVYFIVPNGEYKRGVHDEGATHMHVDIMMFFLLFLLIALLYYSAMLAKDK